MLKIRKLVCHFSNSSKASKIIKIIQINFDHAQTKQKALLLVQDVDTRWNSTYIIRRRLNKLKLSVRYYVANYKNDQISNFTPEGLELINDIYLVLAPFFFVTKECSKNIALLSSMNPNAK